MRKAVLLPILQLLLRPGIVMATTRTRFLLLARTIAPPPTTAKPPPPLPTTTTGFVARVGGSVFGKCGCRWSSPSPPPTSRRLSAPGAFIGSVARRPSFRAAPSSFRNGGRSFSSPSRSLSISPSGEVTTIETEMESESAHSKWECLPRAIEDDDGEEGAAVGEGAALSSRRRTIRNLLVCGDGDLSYSAGVAPELAREGIRLTATVLEDGKTHDKVYNFSRANADAIRSHPAHEVLFGVDATELASYFERETDRTPAFDRIQFNFPHWRGKANNRYNRQLLNDFLRSASEVLSPTGEVHVALCDGQGGSSAETLEDWRQSWTASSYAAEHGLLLTRVSPYGATYRLSSHRGKDRPFHLGKEPTMHVFLKPDGTVSAPRNIQVCCRHELHVEIPDPSAEEFVNGDAVLGIVRAIVPDGVRVDIPSRIILEPHETGCDTKIAVFLMVYCSERDVVTRGMADEWRAKAEVEVGKYVPLRQNRIGRMVSKPFPYTALHPEIKYNTKKSKVPSES